MTETEKNYKRNATKFYEWCGKARKAANDFLREALQKYPNIIFDTEYDDEIVTVSYDGGNHPEYASNCFSQVFSVTLDDRNNICLNIEDCNRYDVDNLSVIDLLAVCDAVKDSYLPRMAEEQ